jgi:hypothetical protein
LVKSANQCYRSGSQVVDINGHESVLEEKKVGELAVFGHNAVLEIHVAEGGGRSGLNDVIELSLDWAKQQEGDGQCREHLYFVLNRISLFFYFEKSIFLKI